VTDHAEIADANLGSGPADRFDRGTPLDPRTVADAEVSGVYFNIILDDDTGPELHRITDDARRRRDDNIVGYPLDSS
jgi:hypothetical protein